MSFDGWMDKQMLIHPYSGILFTYKKEWSTDTGHNVDERWKRYPNERRQSQKYKSMITFIRYTQNKQIARQKAG